MSGAGRGRGRQGDAGRGRGGRGVEQMDEAVQMPNPEVQMPNPEVGQGQVITLVQQIKKLGAIDFTKATDPLDAEKWIEDMEKYFEIMDCTEVQKRRIAVFCLSGDARQWWQSVIRSVGDVTHMHWDEFKNRFYDKYFPRAVRDRMAAEFIHLEQETEALTVSQYEAKFAELSRFAPYMVADEESRARKFAEGLTPSIRRLVISQGLNSYADVVERAMRIEHDNLKYQRRKEHKAAEKEKGKGSFNSQHNLRRQQQQQPPKDMHSQAGQRARQDWQAAKRQRVGGGEQSTALVPAVPQNAQPRQFHGQCYNYQEKGHMACYCTKPRKEGQQRVQAPQQQGGAMVYAVYPKVEQDAAPPAMEGTFAIYGSIAKVLFDSDSA